MTHLCINCNAPEVRRDGDTFTCRKCGYRWAVAHEQANAAYLASQGRQPAAPAGAAEQAPARGELDRLEAMTKAELEAFAAERGIALDGDLRKTDMVNAIAAVLGQGA